MPTKVCEITLAQTATIYAVKIRGSCLQKAYIYLRQQTERAQKFSLDKINLEVTVDVYDMLLVEFKFENLKQYLTGSVRPFRA